MRGASTGNAPLLRVGAALLGGIEAGGWGRTMGGSETLQHYREPPLEKETKNS